MTSIEAWSRYTILMNDLREAIASKVKELMPLVEAKYFFKYNTKDTIYDKLFSYNHDTTEILGVSIEDNNVMILVDDYISSENSYELQSGVFDVIDLINILERLE